MTENNNSNQNNQQGKRFPGGPPQGPAGKYPRNMIGWVLIFLIGAMLFSSMTQMGMNSQVISYSDFKQRVQNSEVEKVTISSDRIRGSMKEDAMQGKDADAKLNFEVVLIHPVPEELNALLDKNNVDYSYQQPNTLVTVLLNLLPWFLIFGIMYFFIFRQFRAAGGAGMLGSFGRSKHLVASKETSKVNFKDVAGIDEAKDEVQEIIQFLRNPKKFQRLGGRIPRGILLVGEPGCGKTLLAKAIAGEADVPFFSISGSDFVEMFAGVGASRARDLFKQAKDNSPCIIFLDEIDAVGRKRSSSIAGGGGHDEREQTLNAILVEMDGFGTNDQVIVIAATNRADVLDNALTRPGRFDRQIYVPLPDIKGRMEIIKVHAKKVKMGPDIDLHRLARGTPMFSGADLEAIINEAALSATMANKDYVEMQDLEEARDKVRWGRARRSRVIDEKERIATAFHEAGHAIVQSLLEDADPVHKVSIIPRANMGGATFSLPEQDRTMYTRKYCMAMIKVAFGGRVAEELFCNDISSGAQGDIHQATEIAHKMILEWGMSEKLGFVRYGREEGNSWLGDIGGKEYSDRTAEVIDEEIKHIMDSSYSDVKNMLETHREQMESLKDALIKYETIDGEEVQQIIDGKPLTKPTVQELLSAEQKKTTNSAPSEPKKEAASDQLPQFGIEPKPEMG